MSLCEARENIPVHEVVGHDVDHINSSVNLRCLLRGEGNHVALQTGDGNGEFFAADSRLDLLEQKSVTGDLVRLARVGVLAVVTAVAAGVFPVNVYKWSTMQHMHIDMDNHIPTQS